MKIGLLTLPLHKNVGGNLQAYALQTFLQKQGHDVWFINRKQESVNVLTALFIEFKRLLFGVLPMKSYNSFLRPYLKQRRSSRNKDSFFITEFIHPKTNSLNSKSLSKLRAYRFDAIIVGSDQVWRPKYSTNIYHHFFSFLEKGNWSKQIIRIAYAASFGTDEWEFSVSQTNNIKHLAHRINSISVREESAIELCEKNLGLRNVEHVLDPVFLLNREDYKRLVGKSLFLNDTLFAYILDFNTIKDDVVMELSSRFQLKVNKFDSNDSSCSDDNESESKELVWLNSLISSKYVITDSFHGCVFSILFNKPFIALGNEGRGLSRFQSLLKMFSLEHRLVLANENMDKIMGIEEAIDWERVNRILEDKRTHSINFMVESLRHS